MHAKQPSYQSCPARSRSTTWTLEQPCRNARGDDDDYDDDIGVPR